MAEPFEPGPEWAGKVEFAPGVPLDPADVPKLRYQTIMGRVYVLQRWPDGSTVRGEITLQELEALVGSQVREGWYDALGNYLGIDAGLT